jgi:hypothetical protein
MNRYLLSSNVPVSAGAAATVAADAPSSSGSAGKRQRCHYRRPAAVRHLLEGTAIVLDPAGGLFMATGPPTCGLTTASTTLGMRPRIESCCASVITRC